MHGNALAEHVRGRGLPRIQGETPPGGGSEFAFSEECERIPCQSRALATLQLAPTRSGVWPT